MVLPQIALSVRQPWAWAVIHAGKDIENRSSAAVTKGEMRPMRIAVHAAKGMTKDEYEDARAFMLEQGVDCPRPDDLIRGGVIGEVTVTAVVSEHESPWFFGPRGLVLAGAMPCNPVPASGALGFFQWREGGKFEAAKPWMRAWPNPLRRSKTMPAANPQEDLPLFPVSG